MNAEKVILSFVAVFIGLLVAGAAFFLYQSTHTVSPSSVTPVAILKPSPTPAPPVYLVISNPTDESVVNSKVLTIQGKTVENATIIVSTSDTDQVVNPSQTGDFTVTTNINDGENLIYVEAISPQGQENQKILTVTYSTEQF